MNKFTIKKLPYDLSSLADLAFVGIYLKRINLNALFYQAFSVCSGVANSMLLKSYLALMCLGKPGGVYESAPILAKSTQSRAKSCETPGR